MDGSDPPNPHRDMSAADALTSTVYGSLREIASKLSNPRQAALQPTLVVHEAYVRLAQSGSLAFESKEHFLAVAAKAMRHVVADAARARNAQKRGGGWMRSTLAGMAEGDNSALDYGFEEVAHAIDALEQVSPRQARIVELRFFAGLTVEQVAQVLGVSDRTIRNDWRVARAWLRTELDESCS